MYGTFTLEHWCLIICLVAKVLSLSGLETPSSLRD